jgi:hypothetical protein
MKKIDEIAPVITPAAAASMWPPNHEYTTFDLSQLVASVTDDCDNAPWVGICYVDSDEPEDARGGGDGNTTDDIVIAADCQSVQLRAERQGGGNGRVYTVHLMAMDAAMNMSMATCVVTVPHSMSGVAVDDGSVSGYTAYGPCAMQKAAARDMSAEGFALEQNYPNPFNPATIITYTLPEAASVRLRVFNAAGETVGTLVDGAQEAGTHRSSFDAATLPSGMYLYRLEAGGAVLQRAMQLVK